MTDWKPHEIRKKLEEVKERFGLKLPQVQILLCQERFLSRLAGLQEGQYLIWKGGSLVFRYFQGLETPRFTVDLDFLARGIKIPEVTPAFQKAAAVDLEDGFTYRNIRMTPMRRETPYGGDRYEIDWTLFGKGQSESLKIDVCAGDDVDSEKRSSKDLFLIPDKEIFLKVYPPEFIFAEKFETAVRFYTGNTRLKDFIDMYALVRKGLDPAKTKAAIERCLKRRETDISAKDWQKVFTDRDFIKFMENHRLRNFERLELPKVDKIFQEVLAFLQGLGLQ